MKKRFLCYLLCAVLIISAAPVAAMADTSEIANTKKEKSVEIADDSEKAEDMDFEDASFDEDMVLDDFSAQNDMILDDSSAEDDMTLEDSSTEDDVTFEESDLIDEDMGVEDILEVEDEQTETVEYTGGTPEILMQPGEVNQGLNKQVCFAILARNAVSYQWYYSKDGIKWYPSSASGANTASISFTLTKTNANNLYRCKVTGADGSYVYTEAGFVTLLPSIKITKNPVSAAVKIGEYANFTIDEENAYTLQWQFSKDGVKWYNSSVTGSNSMAIQVKASSSNIGNLYRVLMTDGNGDKKASKSCGFVQLTKQPVDSSAVKGQTASFSVQGPDIVSYQWQYSKDGISWYNSNASGANTAKLSLKVSSTSKDNIYRCKVTDSRGITGYSTDVGFTTYPRAAVIAQQPVRFEGMNGHFVVTAANAVSYRWQGRIDGQHWMSISSNSTAYTNMYIASSDNFFTEFRCKITGKDGSITYSDTATYHWALG